jgi:hypothetical protein
MVYVAFVIDAYSRRILGWRAATSMKTAQCGKPVPAESAEERDIAAAWAVRLFLDRGSAARGGATAGVAPRAVAGRICRKLDGLPLAIELAAARLSTLTAVEIEANLAHRFAFLAYRRPVADPRHQALRAAMDWSYDLLSEQERRVLGELAVFAGSFGLAQVAEVCTAGDQGAALDLVDDERAATILSAVRNAASPQTRLLLIEAIIPDVPGPDWSKTLDTVMLVLPAASSAPASDTNRCCTPPASGWSGSSPQHQMCRSSRRCLSDRSLPIWPSGPRESAESALFRRRW